MRTPLPFRNTLIPYFSVSILICLPLTSQTSKNACQSPAEVQRALKQVNQTDDDSGQMPEKEFRAHNLELLRTLLRQYPNEVLIHRRYQDWVKVRWQDEPPLIEEYRTRLAQHPDDPMSLYLYGRLLVGMQTNEAIACMEKCLQKDSNFAWAHLTLAQIYQTPVFRDLPKAQQHLRAFLDMCPSNLLAYSSLYRIDDEVFLHECAQRLRKALTADADPDDLTYYRTL